MKTTLLLPHYWKNIGWILLTVFILLFVFISEEIIDPYLTFDINIASLSGKTNFTTTIKYLLPALGGLLICFSKEKIEDEFVMQIRLKSWMLAILINYLIFTLEVIFVYGFDFVAVLIYHVYIPLVLFIIIFHFLYLKNFKLNKNEE